MAITYDDAQALLGPLKQKHERRHWELAALRRYWQGHYWDDSTDRAGVNSVSQLFRDLKGSQSDVGPDLKLVHNLLQEICVKYQTFLSPVPMIRTFRDPPFSDNKRKQATLKERVLYGTWWMNKMARRMGEVAWFLPLMGDCFVGVWPDYDRNLVRMVVRSPENAHPVPSMSYDRLDAIMFRSQESEAAVMRAYPGYTPSADEKKGRYRPIRRKVNAGGDRKVELVEYSADDEFVCFADDQVLRRISHGFGFNLFGQMGFIPVPGEDFNHGAVEQVVSMVEMGNALRSLNFQAMLENVFPTLVLTDPSKAPADILRGPGSVIPLNPGGKAEYLTPPVQAVGAQMAFIRENADTILEAAAMPRVSLGQSPATSIVTGAAVNELQGAGSGSTVEMVQGTELGPGLSDWNEKALFIYANEFRDATCEMYAIERVSGMELQGRGNANAFTFRGSEIVGSYRNEIVFSPHMNEHEKLVMNLQAKNAGLISDEYAREAMGISDNDAMVEAIHNEMIERGLIESVIQGFMAAPTEEAAVQAESRIAAFVDPAPTPHPLLSLGQTPTQAAAPTPAAAPAAAVPSGGPGPAAPPTAGGAPAGPSSAGPAQLNQVAGDIQGVQGLSGRVWLIGEIVQRGETDGPIEGAVTEQADGDLIQKALPQYQFRWHVVTGEPGEQAVEVTPGTQQPQQQAATAAPA